MLTFSTRVLLGLKLLISFRVKYVSTFYSNLFTPPKVVYKQQ